MKKLFPLFILFVLSCTSKNASDEIFERIPSKQSGITFNNTLTENDSVNYFTYAYIYMGGGVASGDINNDGLIDLYFTGNMVSNKLYLNKGDLEFEDISESANVQGGDRWFTGVTMADVNGDGFLDIYCSVAGKYGPKENLLYINNGDLTFTERAKEYGVDDIGNSVQATFFDYDLDGDLDLYVANYPPTRFNAPNKYYQFKMFKPKDDETDKLFRNEGDHFTNVTDEAGLRTFGLSLSATVGDINKDGWPDLYVSNDFSTPDYLFMNNQDGTFSERVKEVTNQTAFYGMGVDIADYNNDQLLDIFQVDMSPQSNRRSKANMASMNPSLFWGTVNAGFHYQYMQNNLQLNNGMVTDSLPDFSNVSRIAGVSSTDWSWGPLFADLDNDGWKDLFVTNGTRREINNRDFFLEVSKEPLRKEDMLAKSLEIPSERIDNFVYRNKGDLTFEQTNKKWGIEFEGFSNGATYADLDNDGDLEIIINNIDDEAVIFENKSSKKNNFLKLKFDGPKHNSDGLGVKVSLTSNGIDQYQELTLSRGFQSSVAPELHFGIGKAEKIEHLKVMWPDGAVEEFTSIPSNSILTINHVDAKPVSSSDQKENALLFASYSDVDVEHIHTENYYDDFVKEILLPHRTSTFGPGLAVGDLNNDGKEDFIVGGATQSQAGVYFQSENGFVKQTIAAIAEDSIYEDLGSLIFDADNDGDNDLYMVSGGNEFTYNSDTLQDRLYINDGNGNFTKSSTGLPKMLSSGSRVHSMDYDKDGDLDLFVGGRLVPGNYPSPASSYILKNESSENEVKFIDVTETVAPDLSGVGLVTSASWTDIDQDGWTDLVVVGEWMPITVLKNNEGEFEDVTEKMGLRESNGWWFSIKEGDFDKDGDMDFVVGNLGLNYKYNANEEETFDIYFNDFDLNSKKDIVLSYYNEGEKFPVRGRECSSQQIPAIKQKFEDYESFAGATLEDIYTENDLEKSLHYQVRSFASIYLENTGEGFEQHHLPNLAQLSSINQILVKDFDEDSNLDIVVAGNLYASEVETPRNDAGKGLFLKGNGEGSFSSIPSMASGWFTPGDVKDMGLITIDGRRYAIVAKNSDRVQFVEVK